MKTASVTTLTAARPTATALAIKRLCNRPNQQFGRGVSAENIYWLDDVPQPQVSDEKRP